MKKLLFIPRAILDILSVWNKQLTLKEKSSLTYTIIFLKLKKWLNKKDSIICYPLFQFQVQGPNNGSLQMLVKEIFIDRIYELPELMRSSETLKIIDAGSNTGLSVLFFKKYFKNCRIEAYEPNEISFLLLQKNMEKNKIKDVQLVQAAINDREELVYAEEGFGPASINQKFSAAGNAGRQVATVRLAKLLQQQPADCVKLDIEGDEIKVLEEVIQNNGLTKVKCWLIEFHDDGELRGEIILEFKKNGFVYEHKKDVYCFWQTEKNG